MSVNIFKLRFIRERQPRAKKGQPAHSTTGVLRMNCPHRDTLPLNHWMWPHIGIKCAIATMNTGKVRAVPIQKRRVMSRSSELSSSASAVTDFGSKAMPHFGQLPGWSCSISGCIGQV
jgi:hypothetical protein